ncbi:hypothetical protein BDZ97DRAFT_1927527 [Flammula alnicola]|nr:hypothetical protein BDZ97DRAFT_1927527 [Flammula alnicola]
MSLVHRPRDGLTHPLDFFTLPDPRHTLRKRRKHHDTAWISLWSFMWNGDMVPTWSETGIPPICTHPTHHHCLLTPPTPSANPHHLTHPNTHDPPTHHQPRPPGIVPSHPPRHLLSSQAFITVVFRVLLVGYPTCVVTPFRR